MQVAAGKTTGLLSKVQALGIVPNASELPHPIESASTPIARRVREAILLRDSKVKSALSQGSKRGVGVTLVPWRRVKLMR